MVWKDENGNTCFGIKPEPPVVETSEDSGAVETPPRKAKEADEKE